MSNQRKFKAFKYDDLTHPDKPWVVITPEHNVLYMRTFKDVLSYLPYAIQMRSF